MGLTVLEIEVGNPAQPEVTEKIEFLIDSGAIYSVVPTPILERLGIKPLAEQQFRLADGTKIVRKKGGALFKYGDRVGVADVIFGEEGDSVLLGAFTLEALGLSLDPLRRELRPLPMILAVLPEQAGVERRVDPEMLKEDLKTYRNIETWGSALFLGGIAVMGKQLLEWKAEGKVALPSWAPWVPSVIGWYAFVFLAVVNRRSRIVRARIDKEGKVNPRGLLGWLFALMPPAFGWVVSAALGTPYTEMIVLGLISMASIVVAFLVDCCRTKVPQFESTGASSKSVG